MTIWFCAGGACLGFPLYSHNLELRQDAYSNGNTKEIQRKYKGRDT